jgi:hypothetical protein
MLHKLGNLVGGISTPEVNAMTTPYGLHGIYHSPNYLPLNFVRSIVNTIFTVHGQFLLRVPNVIFGVMSVIFYGGIVYLWHGRRTAIISTILFACSAYLLHVSRVDSYDIMYFWGILCLLLMHALLYRYNKFKLVFVLNFFTWGLLLTIPGFIYFVAADIFIQRELIKEGYEHIKNVWVRGISLLLLIIWLPLVIKNLFSVSKLKNYLGLPSHFASLSHTLKDFIAVPMHLFIRGPEYPYLWLGRLPILDIFTLALVLTGLFFYIQHYTSSRSKWLGVLFLISFLLIGLNGAVSFSLIVPIAYVVASTGVAYLLHLWLKVFPSNPIARTLGIGLISLAVLISCIYNLRSYYVAWKLNTTTINTFSRRL